MQDEFKDIVEKYKSDLLKYQSVHKQTAPIVQPRAANAAPASPAPSETPRTAPDSLPQRNPQTQAPQPQNVPDMPIIPGEPIETQPPLEMPQTQPSPLHSDSESNSQMQQSYQNQQQTTQNESQQNQMQLNRQQAEQSNWLQTQQDEQINPLAPIEPNEVEPQPGFTSQPQQIEPQQPPVVEPEVQQTPQNQLQSADDEGYFQARVQTADGAFPVKGALVIVTLADNQSIVSQLFTNLDGVTRTARLPAASRELSEKPGNTRPFDTYNIEILAEGYLPFKSENVPIFGGITNVQTAMLIPDPEFGSDMVETAQNTEPDL